MSTPAGHATRERWLAWLTVEPGEFARLAVSFLCFFLLLTAYYMVRPVRDALAAGLPKGEIQRLALIVFVVMLAVVPLFGALVSRVRRNWLVPVVYGFFISNLLAFAWVFHQDETMLWSGRVFYLWITVFNLFVVSVFWSFMADTWTRDQAGRLFGVIASAGSLGGLLGPMLTQGLVESIGLSGVTLIAAGLLTGVLGCILWLAKAAGHGAAEREPALGGGFLAGVTLLLRTPFLLGIAGLVLLSSAAGMIAYNEIARLVKETYATPEARTVFYSSWDLWVNVTALCLGFLFGRFSRAFGVGGTLVLTSLLGVVSFVAVAVAPTLGTLGLTNCARRAVEFGIAKPARDALYSVTDAESRYKAKNAIDTAVYRGGDVLGSQLHGALSAAGLGLSALAGVAGTVAMGMVVVAWATGRGYASRVAR